MLNNTKLFRPVQRVGIYIDRDRLTAVQCGCDDGHRLHWRETVTTADDIQEKSGPDSTTLDEFFARLEAHVGSNFIPVSIALADPWIRQTLLTFEALPRSRQEREALVLWRLTKDWQLDPEQLTVSWQYLGEQDGQHAIVAQSVNRSLLEPLLRQAHNRKLMLIGVDAIGNYLLNKLDNPDDTVFVHIQPSYWSIYVTNRQGWPVHRRSKWQHAPDSDREIDVFAAQIERMVASINHESIKRVALSVDTDGAAELAQAIENRLGTTSVIIPASSCKTTEEFWPGEMLAMQTLEVA